MSKENLLAFAGGIRISGVSVEESGDLNDARIRNEDIRVMAVISALKFRMNRCSGGPWSVAEILHGQAAAEALTKVYDKLCALLKELDYEEYADYDSSFDPQSSSLPTKWLRVVNHWVDQPGEQISFKVIFNAIVYDVEGRPSYGRAKIQILDNTGAFKIQGVSQPLHETCFKRKPSDLLSL